MCNKNVREDRKICGFERGCGKVYLPFWLSFKGSAMILKSVKNFNIFQH
jgi:hypothetical protein